MFKVNVQHFKVGMDAKLQTKNYADIDLDDKYCTPREVAVKNLRYLLSHS